MLKHWLTTEAVSSPWERDTGLRARLVVIHDGGAHALAVVTTPTRARVCQAVFVVQFVVYLNINEVFVLFWRILANKSTRCLNQQRMPADWQQSTISLLTHPLNACRILILSRQAKPRPPQTEHKFRGVLKTREPNVEPPFLLLCWIILEPINMRNRDCWSHDCAH